MSRLTLPDVAARTMMAAKKWVPKKDFHPGGSKGKLHRELGVPEAARLQLDGGADGVITASWDPEAIRPKEEATGPVPLKVPRKRK